MALAARRLGRSGRPGCNLATSARARFHISAILFQSPTRKPGDLSLEDAHTVLYGGAPGDRFGRATAAAYILNRETVYPRDLVVGAPSALGGRGAVYVFRGGFDYGHVRQIGDAVLTILGAPGDRLGTALATGDLDGDGYREIIIGAPGTGRVYVIRGAQPGQIDRRVLGDAGVGPITASHFFLVTGAGGEDIVAGVAGAGSGAGAVYFATSPRMRVDPGAISIVVREGQRTAVPVDVRNSSVIGYTWGVTSNRDWLTGVPSAGWSNAATTGRFQLNVSAADLPPGLRTGTVSKSRSAR